MLEGMSTPVVPMGTGRGIFPGGFNPDPPSPGVTPQFPAYSPVYDPPITTHNPWGQGTLNANLGLSQDSANELAVLLSKMGHPVEVFLEYPLGLGRIADRRVPWFRTTLGAELNAGLEAGFFVHGYPLSWAWHALLHDLGTAEFEQCDGPDPGPFVG